MRKLAPGLLAVLLLLAAATATAGSEIPTPPAALNRYCGGHIHDSGTYTNCQYLAQSDVIQRGALDNATYNEAIVTFYASPALAPVLGTPTTDPNIPPNYGSYSYDSSAFLTSPRLPDTITFPIPYCAENGVELTADVIDYGELYTIWDSNGSTRITESIASNMDCYTPYINYEPVCAATAFNTLDTHCSTEATSFSECANNQPILTLDSDSLSALGENTTLSTTTGYAYEVAQAANFKTGIAACATSGTRYWSRYISNSTLVSGNGTLSLPSTRSKGIPHSDPGTPSEYVGTVTFRADQTCLSTYGIQRVSFKARGIPSQSSATLAAAPVKIRWSESDPRTERVVYVPGLRCSPAAPRPAESRSLTERLSLYVAPYCLQEGNTGATLGPASAGTIAALAGVIGPINPNGGTEIPIGSIMWVARVKNQPSHFAGAYLRYRVLDESSTLVYESPVINVRPDEHIHFYVPGVEGYALYVQKYSASAAWELVARTPQVTGLPACQCRFTGLEAAGRVHSSIPCEPTYEFSLLRASESPTVFHVAPVSDYGDFRVSDTMPVCEIYISNGYLGMINATLQNSVYTLNVLNYPVEANIFHEWSIVNSGQVSGVAITGGFSAMPTQVRIGSVTGTFEVAYSGTYPSLSSGVVRQSKCSLVVTIYRGEPVAILSPARATLGVGGSVTLNASQSYSTTTEYLQFSWAITSPAGDVTGATLSTTGNSTTTVFTALEAGSYTVTLSLSTLRIGVVALTQITVLELDTSTPVPNQPNNCITSIGNSGEIDPSLPPFDGSEWSNVISHPPQAAIDPYIETAPVADPPYNLDVSLENALKIPLAILGTVGGVVLLAIIFNTKFWCCKRDIFVD